MNELLGNRIRAFRCAKNYTQEQIADLIGVSRQKYARIENGINSITLDALLKIADVLGVTVSDITRVLDETPAVQYRSGSDEGSSEKIFDMVNLFYANKHVYDRLKHKDID
ncbi:helix-turn-helix transcriptional regulator [Ruminococcus sp.]|uniref:helix-turn-helix transcriptional regulator n=1 Tax=Ruminococcus sp. TaxID=41978 RepID=UPI0025D6072D|nr:helix-turn-helix transcriptional regulator [Ruminococcus sp.]